MIPFIRGLGDSAVPLYSVLFLMLGFFQGVGVWERGGGVGISPLKSVNPRLGSIAFTEQRKMFSMAN